jgi:hypothetical protein
VEKEEKRNMGKEDWDEPHFTLFLLNLCSAMRLRNYPYMLAFCRTEEESTREEKGGMEGELPCSR